MRLEYQAAAVDVDQHMPLSAFNLLGRIVAAHSLLGDGLCASSVFVKTYRFTG